MENEPALELINKSHFEINGENYIYRMMKYLNYRELKVGDVFKIVSESENHLLTIERIDESQR